ncbi:MAG: imidazole glycerol phosphate synthase subunit HisF [Candidatus Latescibacteria bacterium]|nr:imidazole glycerol phosphate synthase subunit HisF [Candidatus Latescibacterota bacterium]
MLKTRVIPSLLIRNGGLIKTVRFKNARYVGDPINAIKVFNDKEVDELAVIDIDASRDNRGPDFKMLGRINKEAFMPLAYGGGVSTLEQVRKVLGLGYEKIIINSHAIQNRSFITEAANICGSQSVVVCIDVKKTVFGGYHVYDHLKKKVHKIVALDYACEVEKRGAGELLIYSVDRDGTFGGYDIALLKVITSGVSIPVVALGGAGNIKDFSAAVGEAGVSAVSAGSFFVFHGPHRAVLITYPDRNELENVLA